MAIITGNAFEKAVNAPSVPSSRWSHLPFFAWVFVAEEWTVPLLAGVSGAGFGGP
ncbi:hypothetical protein [Streptomyces sp. NPDC052042]|uniref:hypothetical protein n=1 Tax=Streptomyces sp. NPDC052042 TaxID=3365683 RepID=UPI0037D20E3D